MPKTTSLDSALPVKRANAVAVLKGSAEPQSMKDVRDLVVAVCSAVGIDISS